MGTAPAFPTAPCGGPCPLWLLLAQGNPSHHGGLPDGRGHPSSPLPGPRNSAWLPWLRPGLAPILAGPAGRCLSRGPPFPPHPACEQRAGGPFPAELAGGSGGARLRVRPQPAPRRPASKLRLARGEALAGSPPQARKHSLPPWSLPAIPLPPPRPGGSSRTEPMGLIRAVSYAWNISSPGRPPWPSPLLWLLLRCRRLEEAPTWEAPPGGNCPSGAVIAARLGSDCRVLPRPAFLTSCCVALPRLLGSDTETVNVAQSDGVRPAAAGTVAEGSPVTPRNREAPVSMCPQRQSSRKMSRVRAGL